MLFYDIYFHNPTIKCQVYSKLFLRRHCMDTLHWLGLLNKSVGCFIENVLISLHQWTREWTSAELLDDWASETITITPDRHEPTLQPSTCVANTPSPSGSPPPTSPLLSTAERWLLWQPRCHGSIYFSVDLDLGRLHIQPCVSDQMCHTYTLAWSAAGSQSPDSVVQTRGRSGSRPLMGRAPGRRELEGEPRRCLGPRCKNSPPAANFLTRRDWESQSCLWKLLSNNGDASSHRTTGSPIQP